MTHPEPFAPETVSLRDGTSVRLRAIHPDDAPRLQAFFTRLSPQSVFYRLLEYRTMLSDEEARQLVTVDYQSRMAIVAVREAAGEEQIVAVARYGVISPEEPDTAEAAIVVEDAFQGHGLGRVLIDRMVRYARAHGIRYYVATVHYNNAQILHFVQSSGLRVERKMDKGLWDIVIDLETPA